MFFFSRKKPKIDDRTVKRELQGWIKCDSCHELIYNKQLKSNLQCCPKCDHHYPLDALTRLHSLCDRGSFQEFSKSLSSLDPLNFTDQESYLSRLARAKNRSQNAEAVVTGSCTISSIAASIAVMDFSFMGGSMGSVVGEKITRCIESAIKNSCPFIMVSCSGGARMQEGIFSLMQMAKTSSALAQLSEMGLPYISILTHPTTGGVTASFASLGDIILAEPKALICFAGPRVIEQNIGHRLPADAQRSEFLLKHGMIDRIVPRKSLKSELTKLISALTHRPYNQKKS